jgi:hypothetical protein
MGHHFAFVRMAMPDAHRRQWWAMPNATIVMSGLVPAIHDFLS